MPVILIWFDLKPVRFFETQHNPEIDEKFHQLNIGNIGNVVYWWKFFEMIKNVPGDIVECGIGRGRSLIIISALNQMLDENEGGSRHIYGYDSFEDGFPEPTSEDASIRNPKKGEWSNSPSGKYQYTIDFIKTVLSSSGVSVDINDLTLTKGFFNESLLQHPKKQIALLHLDGDLYQSYKAPLEILFDRVSSGGIIVFDDFLAKNDKDESFPGARLAVKEFLKDEFNNLKISVVGTCYYIKPW